MEGNGVRRSKVDRGGSSKVELQCKRKRRKSVLELG